MIAPNKLLDEMSEEVLASPALMRRWLLRRLDSLAERAEWSGNLGLVLHCLKLAAVLSHWRPTA